MLVMKIELLLLRPGTRVGQLSVVAALSVAGIGLTGCTSLRPSEQRLVAKPNMTFSDSAAWIYNSSRLYPQLASGFATAGGVQNSGCTSCR